MGGVQSTLHHARLVLITFLRPKQMTILRISSSLKHWLSFSRSPSDQCPLDRFRRLIPAVIHYLPPAVPNTYCLCGRSGSKWYCRRYLHHNSADVRSHLRHTICCAQLVPKAPWSGEVDWIRQSLHRFWTISDVLVLFPVLPIYMPFRRTKDDIAVGLDVFIFRDI